MTAPAQALQDSAAAQPAPRTRDAIVPAVARNKHVDVMLAIGIVMVLLGHRYQPDVLFLPAYTFHMALFFFISGYLATIRVGLREKLRFVAKKSRTQLLGYFKYNLFFAVVTFLLAQFGLKLGYSIPSFESGAAVLETLRGFFVVPFIDGHQYHLYAAAWFILQLYLVHVLFQFACYTPRRAWTAVVLVAAVATAIVCLKIGHGRKENDLVLTGIRTSFAFLFFLIGYVVKTEEAKLRKVLLAPATLVVCFVLVNVLAINFGNIRYNIVLGDIGNDIVVVPLATTLLIIVMVFQLAHHIARFIDDRSLLVAIGQSTMTIMVWHFSVYFAINAAFYAAGLIKLEELGNNWFALFPEQTWWFYVGAGLAVPMLGKWVAGRVRGARA